MTLREKNEKFRELCTAMDALHIRKSNDYGDSFGQMWERYGITSAMIRLTDKMNRLYSLTSGKTQMVTDESIRDTLMDLASYALMTVIELDKNSQNTSVSKWTVTYDNTEGAYE